MRATARPLRRPAELLGKVGVRRVRAGRSAALIAVVAASLHAAPAAAAAAPRGGQIAFACAPYIGSGSAQEICLVNPNGTRRRALTRNAFFDSDPAWSPDGRRIAFTSNRADGPDGPTHIWIMRRNGRGASRVSPTPGFHPAWSPDGKAIVFATVSDPPRLRIVDRLGEREITSGPTWARTPSWSIDGVIAFSGLDPAAPQPPSDIFTMPATGGAPRNLTSAFPLLNVSPDWSPDGRLLAFASDRATPFDEEIFSMRADGSAPTRLTGSPGLDVDPAWSPDGRRIVFTSYRDNQTPGVGSELYVVHADGSNPQRITVDGGWNGAADWDRRQPRSR